MANILYGNIGHAVLNLLNYVSIVFVPYFFLFLQNKEIEVKHIEKIVLYEKMDIYMLCNSVLRDDV